MTLAEFRELAVQATSPIALLLENELERKLVRERALCVLRELGFHVSPFGVDLLASNDELVGVTGAATVYSRHGGAMWIADETERSFSWNEGTYGRGPVLFWGDGTIYLSLWFPFVCRRYVMKQVARPAPIWLVRFVARLIERKISKAVALRWKARVEAEAVA